MKNLLKYLGIALVFVIVIVAIFLTYVGLSDIPYYEVEKIEYQHNPNPEAIERGEKLAVMLCAGCHLNKETMKLTGKQMLDAPPEFGEIYSANITNDKTYGIGDWTDGELLYLLRTGIKRDGQYSPPYMAKLPKMADSDINAIIAFLRSDNSMVNAEPTPDIESKPSFLTKFLCRVAFTPLPMPEEEIPLPDTSNAVELGQYLAYNLDCFSCHSADFKTIDVMDPPKSEQYFAGGNQTLNTKGELVLTANLTPDKETGIGNWSKEKFINAVKYGRKEGEKPLQYPMLPYTRLTDYEAGAIFEYLLTIPPIKNEVDRSVSN